MILTNLYVYNNVLTRKVHYLKNHQVICHKKDTLNTNFPIYFNVILEICSETMIKYLPTLLRWTMLA